MCPLHHHDTPTIFGDPRGQPEPTRSKCSNFVRILRAYQDSHKSYAAIRHELPHQASPPLIRFEPLSSIPLSKGSPSLFLPFEGTDAEGLMRCHASKGLRFLTRLRGTGSGAYTVSDPTGELPPSSAVFVAALVAWPVVGGVAGAGKDWLIGVINASSSVSGPRSVISLSFGRGVRSSISVIASSSSLAAIPRSWR